MVGRTPITTTTRSRWLCAGSAAIAIVLPIVNVGFWRPDFIMASTLTARSAQLQNNDVALPMLGEARRLQRTNNGDVYPLWFVQCCDRALDRVMAHKEASITLHTDKGNLSRQRSGEIPWDIRRFGFLGQDWAEALIDELRAYFKLDDDGQRLDRALDGLTASVKVIAEIARKGLR